LPVTLAKHTSAQGKQALGAVVGQLGFPLYCIAKQVWWHCGDVVEMTPFNLMQT